MLCLLYVSVLLSFLLILDLLSDFYLCSKSDWTRDQLSKNLMSRLKISTVHSV